MIVAALVAVGAVLVGAALGLAGDRAARGVHLARGFAIAAGLATIVSALLPAALGEAGVLALVAFAAGVVLPRVFSHGAHGREEVGLEVGFVGLLGHQIGDGLALGAYGGHAHAGHDHTDVLVAISAHTVPLAALVVLAFVKRSGLRAALFRAMALAGATLLGIALTGLVPLEWVERYEPYVAACVAGLLFHVVTHGALEAHAPRTTTAKLVELLALCAGASLALLGGSHHAGHADWKARIAAALGDVALDAAPGLAIAIGAAMLVAIVGGRFAGSSASGVRSGVRLAFFRSRQTDVLDAARALHDRGASPATVASYVLSSVLLGVDVLVLVAWLFGPLFTITYAAAALALTCATSRALGPSRSIVLPTRGPREARKEIEGVLSISGPFTVLGSLLAAYLAALVPTGSLGLAAYPGVAVLLVSAIAILAHARPPLVALACAVLVAKGLSPGAALCALLTSSALHPGVVRWFLRVLGRKSIGPALGLFLLATWAIALAVENTALPVSPLPTVPEVAARIMLGVLAAMLLFGVFQSGLSAWVSTLARAYLDTIHPPRDGELPPCGTEEAFGPDPVLASGPAAKRDSDLSRCV